MKTGLNRTDDSIFWDTSTLTNTCADPTNGNNGPFVTGAFNRDGPCDGTPNTWAGLISAAKFTPVGWGQAVPGAAVRSSRPRD